MAEIYKGRSTAIKAKLYYRGEPVITDSDVIVKVYDITQDPLILPSINPNSIIYNTIAEQEETDFGVYSFYFPVAFVGRDRKFKIEWTYEYNNEISTHITYVDVVTPYISIEEAIEDLGLGSDSNDPNNKTYHELRMAEKYARKQVEYYTGQKFNLFDDTMTIMGNDSDTLPLTRKINNLHTLHVNDSLLIDNLNNVNNLGFVVEPTTSGFGIKINQSSLLDNDTYIANGMVPPTIYDSNPNIFKRGKHYDVYARFGWDDVPDEVEQATIEIMRSYFSKDRAWRDRYVNKISTTDWDFEFASDAFTGTGSSYADKLLLDYVVTQMVVF